jgi:hypothetical protein
MSIVFRDATFCSVVDVHRRFGGVYCLSLQGLRVGQASNKKSINGRYEVLFFTVTGARDSNLISQSLATSPGDNSTNNDNDINLVCLSSTKI